MKAVAVAGIETIVRVINIHINNAGVCKWGCRTLMNIPDNGKVPITQHKSI